MSVFRHWRFPPLSKSLHPLEYSAGAQSRLAAVGAVLAEDVNQLERLIDEAIIRASSIGQTLTGGRLDARIAAGLGQGVLEDLAQVIPTAVALRGQVVGMHARMERMAGRIGIEAPSCGYEKPGENVPEKPRVIG